jgi:hypothetical protein
LATITRRRSSRDNEGDETQERPSRRRRSPSGDDKGAGVADEPVRRSRRSRAEDDEPTRERPRRRRGGDEDEAPRGRGRRGTGGFSSYRQKKRSGGGFADEFKPASGTPTLLKFLEDGPFDVYNQHWINEVGEGERKSYVCRDDEYFDDDDGCPLCDIGDNPSTYSLFNVLDLTNPRKPEVKVWKTSPTVTDKLDRASQDKKTSPLDREDLYFEVEMVKKSKKTEWDIFPVKARDLPEDYDMEALDAEELDDFGKDLFTDRTAVTKVDSYEDLDSLAEEIA